MKRHILKKTLTIFGFIAIILTLMPFVAMDYWWIRMFDFPHLQLTTLTGLAILIYFIKFNFKNWRDYFFVFILITCLIYQFSKILPYTTFSDFEVLTSTDDSSSIKLFTSNVLQKNTDYNLLNITAQKRDADILLFTETDKNWQKHIIKKLPKSYKYAVEVPKENTYGMLLYSKLPLFDTQIKYLVSDSIPSIHTKIKLNKKDTIQLFAIHPTPPMPQENPNSTDRDAEMMMIAKSTLESGYPVIVIGDFNDVAWSQTSILFQNVSRLLDARKGRGLFNTYDAKNVFLRWPLDHIFISSEFRLTTIERCEYVGSDHFPLFTVLSFEPKLKNSQERPMPSKNELKRAEEQINKFLETNKSK